MTVFYNEARSRWMYDFVRAGERFQGYCLDPSTGEPVRTERKAKDVEALLKARAAAAIASKTSASSAVRATPTRSYTVAEALADFAENVARHNRQWANQRTHIAELLKHFGADTPVEEISPDAIDAYIRWSREQRIYRYTGGAVKAKETRIRQKWTETDRTRSASTINGYLSTLRASLARAKAKGRVRAVPTITSLLMTNEAPNPIQPEDARKIYDAAAPHLRDVIALCMTTGMRMQECVELRWGQVDLDRGTIRLVAAETKSKTGQTVYLPASAVAILTRLYAARVDGEARVILYEGRPVADVHKAWYRALGRAGLKGRYRFHDTRAAFCTALADLGADAAAIRALARHASISTTLRYIKVADKRLRETVERVPDFGLGGSGAAGGN